MNKLRWISGIGMLFLAVGIFTACEDDEEGGNGEEVMGSITASDQVISQNVIRVESATMENNSGWIVGHKDDNGAPQVPGIFTIPQSLSEGTSEDIMVNIDTSAGISDGETIWLMLHEDTGEKGEYEFDGSSGLDPAVLNDAGNPVTVSIDVISPSITVTDQVIMNNRAVIGEIMAGADGWLVIHKDDGTGAPGAVVGYSAVSSGLNEDVSVALSDEHSYSQGDQLFPMLHIDAGTAGEYEFPGADVPEVFGYGAGNVIVTSFTIDGVETITEISMENNNFVPGRDTVSSGTTVRWINNDNYAHTVDSDDGLFSSGNISAGGTFEYTFDTQGVFNYTCTIHADMDGTIVVE